MRLSRVHWLIGWLAALALGSAVAGSCSATGGSPAPPDDGPTGGSAGAGGSGGSGGIPLDPDAESCLNTCSDDLHAVVDCKGTVLEECTGTEACNLAQLTCSNSCVAAATNKRSIGCEYFPVYMDQLSQDACFAVFIANAWDIHTHITVEYDGAKLPVEHFTFLPTGTGPSLTYTPFVPEPGLAPGGVAIIFLSGPEGTPEPGNPVCPRPSAIPAGVQLHDQSGIGKAFRITTDVPVVAYQINPYGGGSTAIAGSSLLLASSAWGQTYVGLNAYDSGPQRTSMNIVAREDDTTVSMLPTAIIEGGGGLPPASAGVAYDFTLQAGEHAQFTQLDSLTGSVIVADKPVGLLAGARCSFVPTGVQACDHLEQMIPPVEALGSEYVGVGHRSRSGEPTYWRLMGVMDGTQLSWSADIGGPATLERGQIAQLSSHQQFVVKSQDSDHPFVLMAYMSGGSTNGMNGVGDAESVLIIPPKQYLSSYSFFTDPTYPETSLVVVRAPDSEGSFHEVVLDCAGTLFGWQALGDYEYTRLDLITGDFEPVGTCSTGHHTIVSTGRLGLWVWGWGTPQTQTEYVSYGYPGGMNVEYINSVEIPRPR